MTCSAMSKKPKWNWRKYLTPEEAEFMKRADDDAKKVAAVQSAWNKKYGFDRPKIVNRAIQRAKFAEGRE